LRDQNRVFDRYYRGSNAENLTPGSGLGLYVARKIALAHGGTLELENEHPDKAEVSFRLTLPGAAARAENADVVSAS
jgi:signal transduction histidine kinase